MLIVILLIVVGSLLAYISQYNLMPVTLNLGPYIFSDIPLFYVISASVLFGIVLSYLFSLAPAISSRLKIRGKSRELELSENEVLELTKRVHQLELENEKLKHTPQTKPLDSRAL